MSEPGEVRGGSALRRFLVTTDLERLAAARADLDPDGFDADERLEIEAVLHDWDDVQAVANLLMYPELIAPDERMAQLRRALADENTYLRLAGTVGVIELDRAEFGEDARHDLVQKLLAIIGDDRGCLADRASYALVALMHPTDAPEVAERLDHASANVRRNLTQALLNLIGPSGLASLVDEPGFVDPCVQAAVRARLRADGVQLSRPAEQLRLPLIMVYLPSYPEWTA